MSVNSKMTALADEVRTLAGTTAKLGIDAMTTNVQSANSEVENQTTLLAQAIAALEGKTAGGGSAAPVLQNKTVTPATSSQTVTPDNGYDGLARVTVNAIPSNYEDVAEETETYTDSLGELESVINSLPDAGDTTITLQEKTATPSTAAQNILPDSGYDGLSKVTVAAMPTATQATPSITVSSAGLITASATQTAGYVAAGTKSATKQLTTQAAQTITPGTTDQTIASGKYLTGTQTIKGDANLVPANIAEGVSIFGVTGTHAGGGGGSVETCEVRIYDASTYINAKYRPYYVSATCLDDNGNITTFTLSENGARTITITNVLCGSVVTVYFYTYTSNGIVASNCEPLVSSGDKYFNAFRITAAPGTTASISMTDIGGSGGAMD